MVKKVGHGHPAKGIQQDPSKEFKSQVKVISHLSRDLIRNANDRVSHKKIRGKRNSPGNVDKVIKEACLVLLRRKKR